MERKDYAGAITAFHRAMGLGVSSQAEKDIYVALARCHMNTAKTPEDRARAIGLYEEAAERDPEDIELQRELERARTQPIGAEMERGPDGPKPPPGDSGMNQKVKDLEAKVAQKDAEIAALKEQLAKGGAADPDQLAKLTKERDDAAAALAAAQKACEEHNAKLNEANQSLQTANADKAAAVADRDAKMKDLEAAQKSVAELQAKVDEFTRAGGADMQKIQKQLDDATAAKAAAETRVAELEAKVKDLEAKAAAGGAGDPEAMKKLQDELAAAKADVAKAKENEETIKKTVRDEVEKEQSEIIDKLRDTIKSQRQEIEELQKRLKEKQ
jgi:DNA repair exonuclease SbcCD ATPase subunit